MWFWLLPFTRMLFHTLLLRACYFTLSAVACISGIWCKRSISCQCSLCVVHKDGNEARADTTMFIFAEIYTHYGSFKIERIY